MTKQEALDVIKLLSAIESWSFSNSELLPSYLLDTLHNQVKMFEKIVLGDDENETTKDYGWFAWQSGNGKEAPVSILERVDVMLRCGEMICGIKADSVNWSWELLGSDVVKYRLSKGGKK